MNIPASPKEMNLTNVEMETAERYVRFAEMEVRGRSVLYERISRKIAEDRDILHFLSTLPRDKRQPNLLLAAIRLLAGEALEWEPFKSFLMERAGDVRSTMLQRSTQTNEPARCAVLLPLLASVPQPLALIEVGASAGLCLLPEFYNYDFGSHRLYTQFDPKDAPTFRCEVTENVPLPNKLPDIGWRAGLDLNPLDVSDPEQAGWLETLVWPEQTERLAGLRRAICVAQKQRPRILNGDLVSDLPRLVEEVPAGHTVVVFHTAVLSYVEPDLRLRFADTVRSLCDVWISNESPRVFPQFAAGLDTGQPGRFLMALNGSPMAWTDPHGASCEWIVRR